MNTWTPHKYQERSIKFALEQGVAGLFLDPGLGKTSIMLATFKILKDKGMADRMLVIAPLRVCYLVWPKEVEKWAEFNDLTVEILHGRDKEKAVRREADIYVINPEGLQWFIDNKYMKFVKADVLVVDESTKFKRSSTKRFKLLKKILDRFSRRYILTGTPAPNGLMDLFGQIYILDRGAALGAYVTHYRRMYFEQTGYMGYEWRPQPGAYDQVLDKIGHFTLRMEDKDYIELPKLISNVIKIELPTEARLRYNELEEQFITFIQEQEVTAASAAANSMKLRQLTNGGAYTEHENVKLHDEKTVALRSIVEEASGQPVLVYYQFKHDIGRICEILGDIPVIGGGTTPRKVEEYCVAFNAGSLPILLAHPASAAHGLNLQGRSNHVVFYGPTWDLEHHEQAIKRVHRQGNPNTHVFVHYIVAKNTIDEVMLGVLRAKDRVQRNLLEALKSTYGSQENYNGET